MSFIQAVVTATATLLAVCLGGWLTVRGQERLWRRDHARQWRDIRLDRYGEFLTAFREYVAYVLQPSAQISAVPRQRSPNDLMPFFDQSGTPYRERLEASKTAVRLVSATPDLVEACSALTRHARALAAERASCSVEELSAESFERLWDAERTFVGLARAELGLTAAFGQERQGGRAGD